MKRKEDIRNIIHDINGLNASLGVGLKTLIDDLFNEKLEENYYKGILKKADELTNAIKKSESFLK